jgi:hypothetical protein
VRLFVERGLVVTEAVRERYPSRSVFLDGVFDGPPFLDNKARQYSLDHHSGCLRAAMLASCEQAAIMVLQGLPLGEGEWSVFINEPDLDAVLAAWVLLNHAILKANDHRLLRRAMPLIRVEGQIDTHGLEMDALLPIPQRQYETEKARIYELRGGEIRLKASGEWDTADFVLHTRSVLEHLDDELLDPGLVRRARHDQVRLRTRKLAVLCTSRDGIYEVETQLRHRYQDELGLIILDRGTGHVTLRQVDPFLPNSLTELYPLLNARDPSVTAGSEDRWGGAEDIGGSPRIRGTGLSGREVLRIVSELFAAEESAGDA